MVRGLVALLGVLASGLTLAAACTHAPSSPPAPTPAAQAAVAWSPVPGAPAGVTAFMDVAVVPMDAERVLPHQTVLVEHGWITAVGPAGKVKVPAGATRINGQGKFLMPGLADMHVHLGKPSSRWDPRDYASAEGELFLYLANGITTVRDLGSYPPHLVLRARAAAGELLSPRIYAGIMHSEGFTDSAVAAVKAAGYDFIKVGTTMRGRPDDDDRAMFDSLMAAAARVGIRVAGHVPARVGLLRAAEAGMWSTEHLWEYMYSTDPTRKPTDPTRKPVGVLDSAQLRTMTAVTRQNGVWVCPTLVVSEQLLADTKPVVMNLRVGTEFAKNLRIVGALQAAGVGLLLGTDAPPAGVPGFSIHRELALLVAAGLTPYQALVTGTRNVAAFFGTLDSTGTVAVGKRADLVLLSGNPLADVGAVAGPAGVMLGGRWLPRAALDARLDSLQVEGSFAKFKLSKVRQEVWRPVVR